MKETLLFAKWVRVGATALREELDDASLSERRQSTVIRTMLALSIGFIHLYINHTILRAYYFHPPNDGFAKSNEGILLNYSWLTVEVREYLKALVLCGE